MASANPAFNNPAFKEPGATLNGQPVYSPPAAPVDAGTQAQLEGAYAAPPAGARETGRMTIEDTVWKTVGLFAILVAMAAVGWVWSMSTVSATNPSPTMMPWIIGALGGFVLAMIISFSKTVRPPLIFAYAALEGLFVGSISAWFQYIWPGIVVQATLATLSVVGVTLALFASGKVRASKRATKIWMIAMIGYLVFSLINVMFMIFNVPIAGGAFGMLSNSGPLGIKWGVIIGIFVVIMAAYSLVLDFDMIQRGVRNGAPRQYGWLGGFGIMVTVVWLYVEMLRMFAIARN